MIPNTQYVYGLPLDHRVGGDTAPTPPLIELRGLKLDIDFLDIFLYSGPL